jgi:hypothetical protein
MPTRERQCVRAGPLLRDWRPASQGRAARERASALPCSCDSSRAVSGQHVAGADCHTTLTASFTARWGEEAPCCNSCHMPCGRRRGSGVGAHLYAQACSTKDSHTCGYGWRACFEAAMPTPAKEVVAGIRRQQPGSAMPSYRHFPHPNAGHPPLGPMFRLLSMSHPPGGVGALDQGRKHSQFGMSYHSLHL